ncbi:MAG: DMT family transporter, partial [Anaerolineae bacterium]
WRPFVFLGVFNVLVPFGLIAWGEKSIPSGIAAILNASMPLFTLLLAVTFDKEQITLGRIIGLLFGFAGILVLTVPKLAAKEEASILGELAVIVAVISYSVSTVYARRHTRHVNPLTASFGQISMGFVWLLPFALSEKPWTLTPSLKAILAVVAIGVLGTAIAYQIYFRLVHEGGATLASLVTFISPLFGILYGRLVLQEPIHWTALAGLACILASILLIRGAPNNAAALPKAAQVDVRQESKQ